MSGAELPRALLNAAGGEERHTVNQRSVQRQNKHMPQWPGEMAMMGSCHGAGLEEEQFVFSVRQQLDLVSCLHGVREQTRRGRGGLLAGCAQSWECWVMKEALAHVLSYSVLERLSSDWSKVLACPVLQSSLSEVTNRCRRLAAPLCWLFCVNMTLSEKRPDIKC